MISYKVEQDGVEYEFYCNHIYDEGNYRTTQVGITINGNEVSLDKTNSFLKALELFIPIALKQFYFDEDIRFCLEEGEK